MGTLKNWKQSTAHQQYLGNSFFSLNEEMNSLILCLFQDLESDKYYKVMEINTSYGVSSSQMMADTLNIKMSGYTKKWFFHKLQRDWFCTDNGAVDRVIPLETLFIK